MSNGPFSDDGDTNTAGTARRAPKHFTDSTPPIHPPTPKTQAAAPCLGNPPPSIHPPTHRSIGTTLGRKRRRGAVGGGGSGSAEAAEAAGRGQKGEGCDNPHHHKQHAGRQRVAPTATAAATASIGNMAAAAAGAEAPRLIEHIQQPLDYTPFEVKWVHDSTRLVSLGAHASGACVGGWVCIQGGIGGGRTGQLTRLD